MKPSHTQCLSLFSPLAARDPEQSSGDLERAEPWTEGAWILGQTSEGLPHQEYPHGCVNNKYHGGERCPLIVLSY